MFFDAAPVQALVPAAWFADVAPVQALAQALVQVLAQNCNGDCLSRHKADFQAQSQMDMSCTNCPVRSNRQPCMSCGEGNGCCRDLSPCAKRWRP